MANGAGAASVSVIARLRATRVNAMIAPQAE
jgi:hypothetical protein